jgi:hypothetical protein
MVACDFFVSVTATFRVLYVFVAMDIGSRRILHTNVTAHPTAALPEVNGGTQNCSWFEDAGRIPDGREDSPPYSATNELAVRFIRVYLCSFVA